MSEYLDEVKVAEVEVLGRDPRFDILVAVCFKSIRDGNEIDATTATGFNAATQLFPLEHDRRSSGAALTSMAITFATQIKEGTPKEITR